VRTTKQLKERLEQARLESGRSLAQEIEHRLEQSFTKEDIAHTAFGGPEEYRIMQLLALAVQQVEAATGKKWTEDFATFHSVDRALRTVLSAFAPDEPPVWGQRSPLPGPRVTSGDMKAEWTWLGEHIGYRLIKSLMHSFSNLDISDISHAATSSDKQRSDKRESSPRRHSRKEG
jgi:hypothetical protein